MPGRGRGLRKDGKYLPPGQRKCDSGSQTTISYPPASGWRGGGEKTACSYSLFPKSGHVWDDSYKFKKIFGKKLHYLFSFFPSAGMRVLIINSTYNRFILTVFRGSGRHNLHVITKKNNE